MSFLGNRYNKKKKERKEKKIKQEDYVCKLKQVYVTVEKVEVRLRVVINVEKQYHKR